MLRYCYLLLLIASIYTKSGYAQGVTLQYLDRWDNNLLDSFGLQTFSSSWGYTAQNGKEYAIMGSLDSIYFFELTAQNTIKLVSVKGGKAKGCIHREFQSNSRYVYAVADEGLSSLQIFDMSYLPDSIHTVYDSDSIFARAHDITLSGNRLYATWTKRKDREYALSVLDISKPDSPLLIRHIEQLVFNKSYTHEMTVRNDTAYLSNGNEGLFIVNMQDVWDIKIISQISNYPQKGYNHSSILSEDGNYLYFTDENYTKEMKSYSLKKTRNPQSSSKTPEFIGLFGLSSHKNGAVAHNQYIVGNLMFVAYYQEGVVVYDISDKENPSFLAQYDTYTQYQNYDGFNGCWNVYPYYPSQRVIASDQANGLYLLKLDTQTSVSRLNYNQNLLSIYATDLGISIYSTENGSYQINILGLDGKILFEGDLSLTANQKQILPIDLQNRIVVCKLISSNKQSVITQKLYLPLR